LRGQRSFRGVGKRIGVWIRDGELRGRRRRDGRWGTRRKREEQGKVSRIDVLKS
jgi:hypothetical protein